MTIENNERCSAARAFLKPAMDRPNLTVAVGAHVCKVRPKQFFVVFPPQQVGKKVLRVDLCKQYKALRKEYRME